MKVQIGNRTFLLGFRYKTSLERVGRKAEKKAVETTTVELRDAQTDEAVSASVRRHYKDIPNRENARKYALDKLVNENFPGKPYRETRRNIWNAYINRRKEPTAFAD